MTSSPFPAAERTCLHRNQRRHGMRCVQDSVEGTSCRISPRVEGSDGCLRITPSFDSRGWGSNGRKHAA